MVAHPGEVFIFSSKEGQELFPDLFKPKTAKSGKDHKIIRPFEHDITQNTTGTKTKQQ